MSDINSTVYWKNNPNVWIFLLISLALTGIIFYSGIVNMVSKWDSPEFSHAYILPFIAVFFVWQQKEKLAKVPFTDSWFGVSIIITGLIVYVFGELSSLFTIIQYGLLITIIGLTQTVFGRKGLLIIWPVYIIIFFMIPLPSFLLTNLSAKLQLVSSELGVMFIRLFDISVYLEGNVIDLGKMKLQVVDACSGLRYLFPLMALGFIASLFYKTTLWKRVFVFISTFPITVLMNSARIGLIGITVEFWGKPAAEGFLHDFEGWVIFMLCTGTLVIEMWLLTKIGKDKRPLSSVFVVDTSIKKIDKNAIYKERHLSKPILAALILLSVTTAMSFSLTSREEIKQERESFSKFPLQIDEYKGTSSPLQTMYLDELKLNDYIMANYQDSKDEKINLYVAYYDSQRAGESAHSPRTCIPGGGWRIKELSQLQINSIQLYNKPLTVNRTLVQHGEYKQLVYYWFQQRGRVITNEYLVKWYLFFDSLTKNRSDGALVRLTIPLSPGQSDNDGDKALQAFTRKIIPLLQNYIPD